jgi:bacitracin transport system ATP-binding protein
MLLDIKNLKKVYGRGENRTKALKDINFSVEAGEFVAIMGESGSGKSTLLNLIATYDEPSEGHVTVNGQNINELKNKNIAKFRREELGFVFQDFNVQDTMSNRDNIILPLILSGVKAKVMHDRLKEIAPVLGIETFLGKFPYEISGGQQQRVAIARALITEPSILLADEPTGALDSKTSDNIMELFQDINKKHQTILMVTHSIAAAAFASRVLFIKDGVVYHEIYRGDNDNKVFHQKISDSLSMMNERGV